MIYQVSFVFSNVLLGFIRAYKGCPRFCQGFLMVFKGFLRVCQGLQGFVRGVVEFCGY